MPKYNLEVNPGQLQKTEKDRISGYVVDLLTTVYYTVVVIFQNTKQKGSYALAQCIAKLYSLGYEVSLPIGDRKPYDLIADDGKHLYKVQAKYAGLYKNGRCKVGLRITGGNQSFNYAKKYQDNDFDYLYVLTPSLKQYLIKWTETKNRNEITIEDPKYEKYLI